MPPEIFDLTLNILKQADSTIEDIYDSYCTEPVVDYKWMDTSKEVTVGCNGWGNQQPWTTPWLLEQILSDSDKHVLSLLCVHAHCSCTVINKELNILCTTLPNEAMEMLNELKQASTYSMGRKNPRSRKLTVQTMVYQDMGKT